MVALHAWLAENLVRVRSLIGNYLKPFGNFEWLAV